MKGLKWKEHEIAFLLNNWGEKSIDYICRKINRSEDAIFMKARSLNLGPMYLNYDGITATELARILNIDNHVILDSWIPKYGLEYSEKIMRTSRKIKIINMDTLLKWLKNNQDKWDSRKVDLFALGKEPNWLKEKRKNDFNIPRRKNMKWTFKEENKALEFYKLGYTYKEIGKLIGRSRQSVAKKINKIA